MRYGFGIEIHRKSGTYYCATCGNMTLHDREGLCENADKKVTA